MKKVMNDTFDDLFNDVFIYFILSLLSLRQKQSEHEKKLLTESLAARAISLVSIDIHHIVDSLSPTIRHPVVTHQSMISHDALHRR